ncbi:hypothetical protein F2Q68_00025220 [Brassica cretica]|uniref:Uncharacterized protein n=1 Tax=Brassica cretica TaxID=69181 RepID=A0A8S9II25_BRACR|nr:hypothetical protein F2Q68_00025220 [Brassica cretica]
MPGLPGSKRVNPTTSIFQEVQHDQNMKPLRALDSRAESPGTTSSYTMYVDTSGKYVDMCHRGHAPGRSRLSLQCESEIKNSYFRAGQRITYSIFQPIQVIFTSQTYESCHASTCKARILNLPTSIDLNKPQAWEYPFDPCHLGEIDSPLGVGENPGIISSSLQERPRPSGPR